MTDAVETSVDTSHLKSLGSASTQYAFTAPNAELLESFKNPFYSPETNPCGTSGTVTITTSEFSSLCPLTNQPDWATIIVEYEPKELCVESKSYKLYLAGYRNFGEFHESCVNRICNDLVKLLSPKWLKVRGEFTPRGGIAFHPTASYCDFKLMEAYPPSIGIGYEGSEL